MKKIVTFLADGFEDIELIAVVDLCRRAGLKIDTVSINHKEVTTSSGLKLVADYTKEEINVKEYDAVFLPGGGGVKALDDEAFVRETITLFNNEKKWIFAICAAPLILGKMGLLDYKQFSCYPSFESFAPKGSYIEKSVVLDDNIITGAGIGYVFPFALKIIEVLVGVELKEKVAISTLIK